MARRQGGTLGGFTPLSTPNAPTGLSVSTSIGSASVSFTAPADTGDGAVTSYIVTAINESTGASFGATGSASPITVSPSPGGTFKIRAQAVNGFGPGRLTEFVAGNLIFAGQALYGWGYNGSGQLGNNSVANKSSPVQVGALINWSQVSAGSSHTAAVTTEGTLFTWGYNFGGRLGDNTVVAKSSPVQVGALTNWSQVSAGSFHTACVTTAGTLFTWGPGASGELGTGNTENRSSPVQVGALTNWAQVSAGVAHTACVTTAGTLFTWGQGGNGRLGHNNITLYSSPVQVGALTNWAQVSAGSSFSACVTTEGTLFSWGYNSYGNLGHNDTVTKSSPVQVGALTTWSQVSGGGAPNIAAVKTDGTLWTWGRNGYGQLADGTVASRSSPIQVGAEMTWTQVEAGTNHVLAILGV
jgi:alpha-tubulin suppressor-like RCC1 family protein